MYQFNQMVLRLLTPVYVNKTWNSNRTAQVQGFMQCKKHFSCLSGLQHDCTFNVRRL
jgi:hypothetical protein